MAETMTGLKRTIYCGDVREEHIGRETVLCGWVQKQRNLGSLLFIDLRDRSGICQIVFDGQTRRSCLKKPKRCGANGSSLCEELCESGTAKIRTCLRGV
jgi:aspartyl-tRNA synthetase